MCIHTYCEFVCVYRLLCGCTFWHMPVVEGERNGSFSQWHPIPDMSNCEFCINTAAPIRAEVFSSPLFPHCDQYKMTDLTQIMLLHLCFRFLSLHHVPASSDFWQTGRKRNMGTCTVMFSRNSQVEPKPRFQWLNCPCSLTVCKHKRYDSTLQGMISRLGTYQTPFVIFPVRISKTLKEEFILTFKYPVSNLLRQSELFV